MKDCCAESLIRAGLHEAEAIDEELEFTCETCGTVWTFRDATKERIVDDGADLEEDQLPPDPEEIERFLSKPWMVVDKCRYCGELIGIGHPVLHLGLCDKQECHNRAEADAAKEGKLN